MNDTLRNFYDQKIKIFDERLINENFSWNITGHIKNMFDIAFTKYNAWKSKQ